MAPTTLTDLPPELLDYITTYLPTAHSLTSLAATSHSLHGFVEKDAWQTFNRTHFPSLHPLAPPSHRDAARTLTTLSKAWARRAFLARYLEPAGDIRSYPGGVKAERWKRPRGQTIGFTPRLDVYEEVGARWRDRTEVLAFSAGAELCVRIKKRGGEDRDESRWLTYRPLSAYEGRDDITTLHLLRPEDGKDGEAGQRVVTGTANGDLRLVQLPGEQEGGEVRTTYFVTNGQPVRSSGLLQGSGEPNLLVANTGDSRIVVYPMASTASKIAPSTSIDILPPRTAGTPVRSQRIWSTDFLSSQHIAAGLGPSEEPIHIFELTPSGLEQEPTRKFSLHNSMDRLDPTLAPSTTAKKPLSSVYPIIPLPPSNTASASSPGTVFLSGAYDGVIRLHDLRSRRDVEKTYTDPTDDSAIYSLLARGQETLVAGTSRHSLLKVYDLRLGARHYDYRDALTTNNTTTTLSANNTSGIRQSNDPQLNNWSLFLRPTTTSAPAPYRNSARGARGGGGGHHDPHHWPAARSKESSIYSLCAASPTSPHLYAGLESAVLALEFTGLLDPHPDPAFFSSPPPPKRSAAREGAGPLGREVLDLACYEQTAAMQLRTQRSLAETRREGGGGDVGWDERWRVGGRR